MVLFLTGVLTLAPGILAAAPRPDVYHPAVAAFLRATVLQSGDPALARRAEYIAKAVDLNDDNVQEIVVYLAGSSPCAAGGCELLVLTPQPRGQYRIVSRTSTVTLPVQALASKNHGWRDLVVTTPSRGGRSDRIVLPFDGTRYPADPRVAPASRLREVHPVEVVIAEDDLLQPLMGR